QAETFLMRVARGSGVDGLASMAPEGPFPLRGFDDLRLLRPLLGFSHQRSIATLVPEGQFWIEDPSNDATRFARVRLRDAREVLEALGLTNERLAETAANMRRARDALEAQVDSFIARAVEISPWGYVSVRLDALAREPSEVGLRALARLLALVG